MANADIGLGAKFQRETTTPGSYANLGELVEFTPPAFSRETVDVTHYESPGGFREYVGALRDAGEASCTIQFETPADLADAITDYKSDSPRNYRIVWPDATNWVFSGLITNVEPEAPMDDKMVATITIKLVGRPDFLNT